MVKESLSRDQFRLYQLIWKRFAASRMASAVYETTNVKIGAGKYRFGVAASKVSFEGFMSVYTSEDDEKDTNNVLLKGIDEDTKLTLDTFDEKQHFTQPPAHYTEASLVKTLEELGIGRPSTYSPTITTLLGRRYIVKEAKNLYVTELGEVVNQIMKESFPSIVDEHFTANMESLLDSIGEGGGSGGEGAAESQDRGRGHGCCLRPVRKKHGGKIRTARKIPGMPGLPGVQEHEAVSGKNRRAMSEVRKRRCPPQDEERQKVFRLRE